MRANLNLYLGFLSSNKPISGGRCSICGSCGHRWSKKLYSRSLEKGSFYKIRFDLYCSEKCMEVKARKSSAVRELLYMMY